METRLCTGSLFSISTTLFKVASSSETNARLPTFTMSTNVSIHTSRHGPCGGQSMTLFPNQASRVSPKAALFPDHSHRYSTVDTLFPHPSLVLQDKAPLYRNRPLCRSSIPISAPATDHFLPIQAHAYDTSPPHCVRHITSSPTSKHTYHTQQPTTHHHVHKPNLNLPLLPLPPRRPHPLPLLPRLPRMHPQHRMPDPYALPDLCSEGREGYRYHAFEKYVEEGAGRGGL